jgi:hypothetical protein
VRRVRSWREQGRGDGSRSRKPASGVSGRTGDFVEGRWTAEGANYWGQRRQALQEVRAYSFGREAECLAPGEGLFPSPPQARCSRAGRMHLTRLSVSWFARVSCFGPTHRGRWDRRAQAAAFSPLADTPEMMTREMRICPPDRVLDGWGVIPPKAGHAHPADRGRIGETCGRACRRHRPGNAVTSCPTPGGRRAGPRRPTRWRL